MEKYDNPIEPIKKALTKGNCGDAIYEMNTYLTAWPEAHTQEKLDTLRNDYERMADYWLNGGSDPERQSMYQSILQRVYVLYANVRHYHRMQASPYMNSLYNRVRQARKDWSLTTLRQEMEGFVSDVAMLELEAEQVRQRKSQELYHNHQQFMNQLFEYVVTSRQWTESVGKQFTEILLSPTIDSMDQQMLVSAITLSLLEQFDMAKFRILTTVYRRSEDDAVKERALVGWTLSLDTDMDAVYGEQREIVARLVQQEEVCKELSELQTQLLFCLNVDKDSDTMRQDIMPELLKESQIRFGRMGIVEKEEDPLEDILDPGASERRTEKLESTFQRMMDMQKEGSDIYFGGFSHMKNYPFFYDISNWFVPFYQEHPDLQQYFPKEDGKMQDGLSILKKLMEAHMFCDSDRYSFAISFQQLMKQMPKDMLQIIKDKEYAIGQDGPYHTEADSSYVRRSYLMDLTRFYRLYSHRSDLTNPFDVENHHCELFCSPLFENTELDKHKTTMAKIMRKHHFQEMSEDVLRTVPEELHDITFHLLCGNYEDVLDIDPDNEQALAGAARNDYNIGLVDSALEYYEHLLECYPEKKRYMLNKAICLLDMKKYSDAERLLFELIYDQPDNINILRVLAWTLTNDEKPEQARKYYKHMMTMEHVTPEDHRNYGFCLWLLGQLKEALEQFRQSNPDNRGNYFPQENEWLRERNIGETEIKMMETLLKFS